MSRSERSQEEMAGELAEFLTSRDRRDYRGRTPLEAVMEEKITGLAREVADQVIAATPQLRRLIEGKIQALVTQALASDPKLNSAVVKAVTDALTAYREGDD